MQVFKYIKASPILIWLAGLWLTVQLPLKWQRYIGKCIGFFLYLLIARRRHIAKVNIELCFSNLTAQQRQELLKAHFSALGIGLVEVAQAWWLKAKYFDTLYQIEGLEHIKQGLDQGKGVILLSAHFSTLEIAGRILSLHQPFAVMYRQHENPFIEYFFKHSREKHFQAAIKREDIKGFIKILKQNKVIWYAPDQSMKGKHSLLVPFFGIPAATSTATHRLAKLTGAMVIPFLGYRQSSGQYQLKIFPPLNNFPSEDVFQDTLCINQCFEDMIQYAPEQYFWLHRKFKKRKGMQDPYTIKEKS